MSEQHFIWLDLETTGLNPSTNRILEVAAVATDANLKVLGTYNKVLEYSEYDLEYSQLHPDVVRMHTDNGLFEDCKKSVATHTQVDAELVEWAASLKLGEKPLLAGNTVHFDKAFLAEHMPLFNGVLHYRILDVSTIKEMLRNFYNLKIPKASGNHRAANDVHASIDEFQKYRSILKLDMSGY